MKQALKTDRVGFREDAEVKKKAAVILESMGLDISSVCRMLLRQIVRTKAIPFRMESGLTAEGEQAILQADEQLTEDIKNKKAKKFSSAKALINSLD